MVTCQSANQLKTPAKVSWAFKTVSQFGSLGYTIMGKPADLTVFQKNRAFTRRLSHKHSLPKKLAVHRVLYPSMLTESWVEWKRCTTNRENRSLMRIVKQNRFRNLGELHKEWTEAGVKASRATTHRRVKEFVYSCHQRHLTWAKEKKNWTVAQWSKVLFSDESKFCIYKKKKKKNFEKSLFNRESRRSLSVLLGRERRFVRWMLGNGALNPRRQSFTRAPARFPRLRILNRLNSTAAPPTTMSSKTSE